MDCPNCNSSNLSVTNCCNCGYNFSRQQVPESISEPLYLSISIKRLIIMSILSLNLYEAYWLFKNWSYIKKRENINIWPFWRGFFGVFFCHSLLRTIYVDSTLNKIEQPRFSPSVLATGWVIMTIIGNIANRFTNDISSSIVEFIVLVFTLFTFIFFIPVQQYINKGHKSLGYNKNYNLWSAGHIVCIVWGIIFWFFIVYGLFL